VSLCFSARNIAGMSVFNFFAFCFKSMFDSLLYFIKLTSRLPL
jgi:hypothetical protein